jgi:hypothetical protein
MKPLVALLTLAFLLSSTPATAQPFLFGEEYPLTNTRYVPVPVVPTLVSNGSDLLVFWQTETNIRVAKVVDGERRGGKSAFDQPAGSFAVAWNGRHFLLAAQTLDGIYGQLLTRTGEPVGTLFPIVSGNATGVKLASNGSGFLLVYQSGENLQKTPLNALGQPAGLAGTILVPPPGSALASYAVASDGNGYAAIASVRTEARVFLFDSDGKMKSNTRIYSGGSEAWTGQTNIASNGLNYLAVWQGWGGRAFAVAVSPTGVVGVELALHSSDVVTGPLAVAWNGGQWLAGYTVDGTSAIPEIRVVSIDALVTRIEAVDGTPGHSLTLAAVNGSTYAAWRPSPYESKVVAERLPFGGDTPQPVAHQASWQIVAATAASHDATLVAWMEQDQDLSPSLHAGLRARDGGWTEREIAADVETRIVAAASDGREYVLILATGSESAAVLLDDRGRVARRVPLPLLAVDVEWDGTNYLLLGSGNGFGVAAATLSTGGIVSAPVGVEQAGVIPLGIATNGTTSIAAWIEPQDCPTLCIVAGYLRIVRLDHALQRLDAASLVQPVLLNRAAIAWDGTRFLAALDNLTILRVPLSGEAVQTVATIPGQYASHLVMTGVAEGVALAWTDADGTRVNHAAVVRQDNTMRTTAFPPDVRYYTNNSIAEIPGGGILYVDTRPQLEAPHHGSFRLMARVAPPLPATRPDAPSLQAVLENGRIQLDWTAPPQTVNGYRVEYLIGDGSWHELEQWFDPRERSVALSWTVTAGVPVQFRVRAFNDTGISEYSAIAGVNTPRAIPRRRSVRR